MKEQSHKFLAMGKRNRYLCELIAREPGEWGPWTSGMSGSLRVRLPFPEEAKQKAKEERASNSSSDATPRTRRSTASFPKGVCPKGGQAVRMATMRLRSTANPPWSLCHQRNP